MSKHNRLMGSAAIYFVGNTLNATIPFFLLPVLTRVLTPADYGVLAMFLLTVNILGAFTGLSVHGAVAVRYFKLDESNMAQFVGSCLQILAVTTLVTLLVVVLALPALEAFTQLPGSWLICAVFVSSAQFVINIRLSLWQVKNRPVTFSVYQVLRGVLNIGLSFLFVFPLAMAWEGRALGHVLATAVFAAIGALLLWRASEVTRPETRAHAGDALRFGVPLVPHVLGGLLIVSVDRFMINSMLGLSETGIYMAALQIGMALGLLTEAFNRAYAPWLMGMLAKDDPARDLRVIRGTYLYFGLLLLAATLLALLAPFMLSILVGEEFRSATGVVAYTGFGFAFGGMYYMVTNYVFFSSKTGYLALNTFISGLFNIAATYVLIKWNGLVGAAQAFMLSQLFLFLGTWWIAHRVRPMPWRRAVSRRVGLEC